jgi:hypothetical protein
MGNNRGLLYPALHKFYSALSSLAKFEKGTNFFDNIGYLDNFFSEYRNITFVLQKSLAHTEHKATYEVLRNKYLVNEVCKWFIEKRNEVLKQQPFDLEKRIVITIYSGQSTLALPELVFTIDNDVKSSVIIDSLRQTFLEVSSLEVMFSAEFFFYEHGHTEDLYDAFIEGIGHMKQFLAAMRKAINEECRLSDELEAKIGGLNFYRVPKNMLLVDDYVFYCKKNFFEKASRVEMWAGHQQERSPIANLISKYPEGDVFQKFELMHLVTFQLQNKLMATTMVTYNDDTFSLSSFGGSIKTTVYRKLYELALLIEKDGITAVHFVTEMYVYDPKIVSEMDSRERLGQARKEILAFFMADKDLTMKAHSYDTRRAEDYEYIASVMFRKKGKAVLPGFMNPITYEFSRLKAAEEKTADQT